MELVEELSRDMYTFYIANSESQRLGKLLGKEKAEIVQPIFSLFNKTKKEVVKYYDIQIRDHKRRGFTVDDIKKIKDREETILSDGGLETVWIGYYKEDNKQ